MSILESMLFTRPSKPNLSDWYTPFKRISALRNVLTLALSSHDWRAGVMLTMLCLMGRSSIPCA